MENTAVRLLLVEDEPLTVQMLAKGLRERAYAVDIARNGHDAILQTGDNDYDVIILDLGLPDGDGLDVCRRLRVNGVNAPILILTARQAVGSRIAGLDSGADDYLLKPFDLGELLARLRALIRRGVRPPGFEQFRVGSLVVDTRSQQAFCREASLPLTTREYALLEHMIRHAGRVMSRADIAEHVWDNAYDPMSNVVDVYVRRLRTKLAQVGCGSIIQTRRGAGYILSNEHASD